MKTLRLATRLVVALGLSAFALGARGEEIKLGFNGDLSASPSAQSGKNAVLGLEAAIEDINAAGGVLGRKLTLVVRDDLGQPPKSIQNMTDLIDGEKVVAVFGPTNSGNALAWKHIPNQKKIPVLNPISSATDVTKPMSPGAENYMFRVSMVDRYQVAGLVAYAKKNPAVKKIGFMGETTGYGQGGLKDLEEIGELQGLKPVAVEKFGVADTDMTSQLNKMKAAGVDTILVWAQGTPLAHLVRSMEKINYFPLLLSSWAADNATFSDTAGKALAEKPIFMRATSPARTPQQQKLYDRLSSKISAPSQWAFAAHAYDALGLLAAAMKQAGTTDGPKVREALENLKAKYEGYVKTHEKPFSKTDHEALKPWDLVWSKWQDGKLVPYTDKVIRSLKPEDFKR